MGVLMRSYQGKLAMPELERDALRQAFDESRHFASYFAGARYRVRIPADTKTTNDSDASRLSFICAQCIKE